MATLYTQVTRNKEKSVLYIGLFIVLIAALGWFASYYFDSYLIFPIALAISVAMSGTSYWYSDRIAMGVSRARQIEKKDNPYIYRMVENLCITAGLPVPKVYFIDDTAINAFATGRDPKHASIAVTRGAVEKLENEELEGVLAHELSHVGNYDTRLSTIVMVLVGLITLLADFMIRMSWFGGGGRDRDNSQLGLIIVVAGFVLLLLSPLFATMIQLAVSRKREYAADASGALLTRYPDGLANALEKIEADQEPLEVANKATAHLYIANPFKGGDDDDGGHKGRRGWFSGMFDTHPPLEERIKILRNMDVKG